MATSAFQKHPLLALSLGVLLVAQAARADTAVTSPRETSDQLYRRIESMDRALFEAFNGCDLDKLESFFVADLEFYHDKGGLTASRAQFISDVKQNVCGKFRRELVAGTLEVWPLGDYGAVYSGTHRFCKTGTGKCEGMGRFMHIWRNQGGDWKITRVVSYDHKAIP